MVQRSTPWSSPGRSSFPSAAIAAAIVFLACLLWLPRIEDRLNPLTGDEPFYVMTSISLIDDGDLDETNNYANRDYYRFYPAFGPTSNGWPSYPDPLPPHTSATTRDGLYSKHGLGMALLVALPFEIGGRTLTLVVLAGIAALITANMALLGSMFTPSPVLAALIALLLSRTNPLFSFSLLIFPEMSAALALVYATRRILSATNSRWQWLFTGCAIASLPWLHYRLAPIAVCLGVIALIQFRRSWSRSSLTVAAAAPLVSALTLIWWNLRLYDSPPPPTSDHAGFSGLSGTINGLAGTFFDQQWGAFLHNPLLILAACAMVPFAFAQPRTAATLAILVLPYLILIAAYRVWWGDWNPPGRYLTVVVPLAVIPLAWICETVAERWRWALLVLFSSPALAIMFTFVLDPQRMYNQPDGSSRLLETWRDWTGLDATVIVPSFVFYSESSLTERLTFTLLGCAWVGTIVTVLWFLTHPSWFEVESAATHDDSLA